MTMSPTTRALLFASNIGFLTAGLLGPIYAIFVQNIGGDVLDAAVSFGIFSIVSGIFVILVGRSAIFKRNLRRMVVLGFGLYALGNFSYLLVQSPVQLFVLQIFLGIANGIIDPAWDGLFSANLSEERAAHYWATWTGGTNIAMGIGALVGGALVSAFSFQVLFILLGTLDALATVVAARILWFQK